MHKINLAVSIGMLTLINPLQLTLPIHTSTESGD
nr:MAG TPA: hypothetical protein [Caudoviricetes sp.]